MEIADLVCMMTQSTCYKSTKEFEPIGVLWHSTGANNPNVKRYVQPDDDADDRNEILSILGTNIYKNDWNHTKRSAGVNAFIGKDKSGNVISVQVMPWNYRPWGVGSGRKGSCNNGWIQFEICEDGLKDEIYFKKVYDKAIELTAKICSFYGLNPLNSRRMNGVDVPIVLDHSEAAQLGLGCNHGDVTHWLKRYNLTMDDVRKDVAAAMNKKDSFVPYKIKVVNTETLNVRAEPSIKSKRTYTLKKNEVYTIVAEQFDVYGNKWLKLKSGIGWIYEYYTKAV